MNDKFKKEVEITQVDRRYEEFRLKNTTDERMLLSSILEGGIRDSLQCVDDAKDKYILLDGFKRLRCAVSLKIHRVPVALIGRDEVDGILELIRMSNARSLNILEQSVLVDQLNGIHGMRIAEIANHLERSPAWVKIRLGMIQEMPPLTRQAVFSGALPVRAYMYNLRSLTRENKIPKKEIDAFVECVAGKRLSTRDLETLANGYFRGGDYLKEQIKKGHLDWTLKQMREGDSVCADQTFNPIEQGAIKDLELVQKYMSRVRASLTDKGQWSESFYAPAHLLVEGILNRIKSFQKHLERFDAQRRKKNSDQNTLP